MSGDSSADGDRSLRSELLSGDELRGKIAAAFVRAQLAARQRARETGTFVVYMINGQLRYLDPDSSLLPDFSDLHVLADNLYPLPPDEM